MGQSLEPCFISTLVQRHSPSATCYREALVMACVRASMVIESDGSWETGLAVIWEKGLAGIWEIGLAGTGGTLWRKLPDFPRCSRSNVTCNWILQNINWTIKFSYLSRNIRLQVKSGLLHLGKSGSFRHSQYGWPAPGAGGKLTGPLMCWTTNPLLAPRVTSPEGPYTGFLRCYCDVSCLPCLALLSTANVARMREWKEGNAVVHRSGSSHPSARELEYKA